MQHLQKTGGRVPPTQHGHPRHTRSATEVSILLKKTSPPRTTSATAKADASSSRLGACPRPVMAQRKPSITPAMGLSPYSHRQRTGTSEEGYATGEANIQNRIRNGNTYRRARCSTFSADRQQPTH